LPLHVAADNKQEEFCKAALSASKASNDFRRIKNAHGQTAAHVATQAVPRRIGPERHHVERHKSADSKKQNKKMDAVDNDDDSDDDHDFGLPILRQIWDDAPKGDRLSGFFERDDDGQTCLHLAAAKGKSK
jgi:ankyrin repeat protein